MKTSTNNDFLSQSQLEDFLKGNLEGKEKLRVKKLLDDCELSKEAVAGYTAIPLAIGDIPSLKKSIALKSGMVKSFWLNVFVISLGIVLLVGMGYALLPGNDKPKITKEISQVNNTLKDNSTQADEVNLIPTQEHFVNPEMSLTPKAVISAGVIQDSVELKTSNGTDLVKIQLKELDRIDTTLVIHPFVPKKPEIGYNGSIGFIQDLKITEFEKYYRKTIEVKDDPLTGVAAQFDNAGDIKNNVETVREIPAEQFLNDGLKAFHYGRYGRCIEKMEVLKKNNPNDLNAAFYMGVSYVKLEMYGKAIPFFDQILNSSNNVFHEEASWYKALALIGNGNNDAAKKILTEISLKDGFYKEKAVAKLKEY